MGKSRAKRGPRLEAIGFGRISSKGRVSHRWKSVYRGRRVYDENYLMSTSERGLPRAFPKNVAAEGS